MQLRKALKGYARSYKVKILNSIVPTIQLNDTKYHIKDKLKDLLDETKSFEFQITLFLAFKKELNKDETMLLTNYFNFNAELIINDLNIDESLEL